MNLRKKAADRNPDEFYFNMHRSKVEDGKHQMTSGSKVLDQETSLLLKTQDMGYLMRAKAIADKQVEKQTANLHRIDEPTQSTRRIFLSDDKEIPSPGLFERITSNTPSVVAKRISSSYDNLEKSRARSNIIKSASEVLSSQRNAMGKGTKQKIQVTDASGNVKEIFKWKRQRLR